MKREDIAALSGNPYPNNFSEYKSLLTSTLSAIRREPTLQILNKELFDDLMEYRKTPEYFAAFFYHHDLEKEPYLTCRKVIAKDKDGILLILDKDLEGQFIEVRVPISDIEPYIRLGITYVENQHRHEFFMTQYIYIDYHFSYSSQKYPRKMKVKSAFGWETRYCDENGHSNIMTNISGIVNEFLDIFR